MKIRTTENRHIKRQTKQQTERQGEMQTQRVKGRQKEIRQTASRKKQGFFNCLGFWF